MYLLGVATTEEGGARWAEQQVVVERLRKEGMEWKQRARDAEQAIKKHCKDSMGWGERERTRCVVFMIYEAYSGVFAKSEAKN